MCPALQRCEDDRAAGQDAAQLDPLADRKIRSAPLLPLEKTREQTDAATNSRPIIVAEAPPMSA